MAEQDTPRNVSVTSDVCGDDIGRIRIFSKDGRELLVLPGQYRGPAKVAEWRDQLILVDGYHPPLLIDVQTETMRVIDIAEVRA